MSFRLRLGLALLLGTRVLAQPAPPVELEGRSAFGDIIRVNRPTALVVEIKVRDPQLQQACTLEVLGDSGDFSTRMPIRLGSTGRVELPLISSRYSPEVKLTGLPSALKYNSVLNPSMANQQDFVALTLAPRKAQFGYLGGYKTLLKQGEVRLNHPKTAADLPPLWWTYLGHDLVVVHDLPSLKLSDEVEKALLQWTQAGGSLVLVSNLDPHELSGTLFQELAPLQASAVEGGMLVGDCHPASVVLSSQGHPLLLRRFLGAGCLWQVTAPVDRPDLLGSALTEKIWSKIVTEQSGLEFRQGCLDNQGRLASLPELPAPATAALAWYLAGYVLLVIPGIYTYLRRKDQVLKLIVVVPLSSTLITFGAYYFNVSGRGRELVLRELGLAFARGGQTQVVLDQTGVLFSPAPLKLNLKLSDDTLLRPNSTVGHDRTQHAVTVQGAHLAMEPERLRQWGISRWVGYGVRQLKGPISLQLNESKGEWRVRLSHRSGLLLSKATLATGSSYCTPVFDVAADGREISAGKGSISLLDCLSQAGLDAAGLSQEDASVLQRQIDTLSVRRPVLVTCVEHEDFSILQPQSLQPKTVRKTYLVVAEDGT